MITKLISGGQTGADRGGLDAAIHCGIPHGGWCPKGRRAEDGVIPVEYHLNEMASQEYLPRTKANVVDSDATIIFTYGPLSGGSLKTATYAHHLEKPYYDVDLKSTPRKKAVEEIVRWLGGDAELNDHDEYIAFPPFECILNVAGSRESHASGIQEAVFQLLVDVLIAVNPACQKFYRLGMPTRLQT
ncbi:MAG: putative molybdenum carrier protein [Nitrospirales bacterium]|nr:putative molybdenum carrier protein [Nitrospirales bacterium]